MKQLNEMKSWMNIVTEDSGYNEDKTTDMFDELLNNLQSDISKALGNLLETYNLEIQQFGKKLIIYFSKQYPTGTIIGNGTSRGKLRFLVLGYSVDVSEIQINSVPTYGIDAEVGVRLDMYCLNYNRYLDGDLEWKNFSWTYQQDDSYSDINHENIKIFGKDDEAITHLKLKGELDIRGLGAVGTVTPDQI